MNRRYINKTDISWAAGLIDGEGCIFIMKRSPSLAPRTKTSSFYVGVKVSMGDLKTVLELHRVFRVGSLHLNIKHKKNKNWSKYHVWLCQQRDCEGVLNKIFPYVRTKKKEIIIALKFLSLPLSSRGGKGGSPVVSKELYRKRLSLWYKMKMIKPRNRVKNRIKRGKK